MVRQWAVGWVLTSRHCDLLCRARSWLSDIRNLSPSGIRSPIVLSVTSSVESAPGASPVGKTPNAASEGDHVERVGEEALEGLQNSYKELLDATKHQDDKIGRLFAGIAFLTAAALAIANLNSAKPLTRQYTDTSNVSLAVLSLGCYIVLVVLSVTLLISSLATPLRVPGLEDRRKERLKPDGTSRIRASQIYFGSIARLTLDNWNRKWLLIDDKGKTELAQSLVLETHNLAVRTQFKYNRTTEAVILFKFALMFLTLTAVLCIGATLTPEPSALPTATKWAVGIVIAWYVFSHFVEETRYSRQTIDEIRGRQNIAIAVLRYSWTAIAATWVLLAAVGSFPWLVLGGLVLIGSVLLFLSTLRERRRSGLCPKQEPLHWLLPVAALVTGTVLTVTSKAGSYYATLLSSLGGAAAVTLFALSIPTLRAWRDAKESRHQLC